MRLRLEKIVPTSTALVCGVQIFGPEDSWVKFGILQIPFDVLEARLLEAIWAYQDREEKDVVKDEALNLDWSGLPPPS